MLPANRRRRPLPHVSGAPGWMVTYGDMVTLLLTFFVMLFAFSSLNVERFRNIIAAYQGAVGLLDGGTTVTESEPLASGDSPNAELIVRNPLEADETVDVLRALAQLREEAELADAFTVDVTERGIVIHFTDRVLFDLGRAELRPDAERVLRGVFDVLASWPHHIRVEGHTDNLPIETVQFPSNWELSTARAARVVRFVVEEGKIPPERLSAAGYGEYRPIADNGTAAGRARNRRVDVVLLGGASSAQEPAAVLLAGPDR